LRQDLGAHPLDALVESVQQQRTARLAQLGTRRAAEGAGARFGFDAIELGEVGEDGGDGLAAASDRLAPFAPRMRGMSRATYRALCCELNM
jgi:hypothetical protein